jgi:hypothetical protein
MITVNNSLGLMSTKLGHAVYVLHFGNWVWHRFSGLFTDIRSSKYWANKKREPNFDTDLILSMIQGLAE